MQTHGQAEVTFNGQRVSGAMVKVSGTPEYEPFNPARAVRLAEAYEKVLRQEYDHITGAGIGAREVPTRAFKHSRRTAPGLRIYFCPACLVKLPPGKAGRKCRSCHREEWKQGLPVLDWTVAPMPPRGLLYDALDTQIHEAVCRCNVETGEVVFYLLDENGAGQYSEDGTEYLTGTQKYLPPLKFVPQC
jgi:hypothetical protein